MFNRTTYRCEPDQDTYAIITSEDEKIDVELRIGWQLLEYYNNSTGEIANYAKHGFKPRRAFIYIEPDIHRVGFGSDLWSLPNRPTEQDTWTGVICLEIPNTTNERHIFDMYEDEAFQKLILELFQSCKGINAKSGWDNKYDRGTVERLKEHIKFFLSLKEIRNEKKKLNLKEKF